MSRLRGIPHSRSANTPGPAIGGDPFKTHTAGKYSKGKAQKKAKRRK